MCVCVCVCVFVCVCVAESWIVWINRKGGTTSSNGPNVEGSQNPHSASTPYL